MQSGLIIPLEEDEVGMLSQVQHRTAILGAA